MDEYINEEEKLKPEEDEKLKPEEDEEKEKENISISDFREDDLEKFIGKNSNTFIEKFKLMESDNQIITWNWSAFLSSPFYFFYRKMHAISFPLFVLFAFFAGASLFYYTELAKNLFVLYANSRNEIMTNLPLVPENIVWIMHFLRFLRIFVLIIMILSGLFANVIYKDHVLENLDKIKKKNLDEKEYDNELLEFGGTNLKPVLIISISLVVVFTGFILFHLSL